jgi:endonuclease/exonuclease/phosphatase family metal-dependent hydrolase
MDLKILQWNVWFKERAQNIVAVLRQVDADIVCVQELTTDSYINSGVDMRSQISALGYHHFYHQTLQHPGKNYYTMGNAIFSKVPIIATKTVYVQFDTPDHPFARENRVYLEAKLDAPGGILTVGTTHLSYFDELLGAAEIRAETGALMGALANNTERFIFTGDLNATPSSYAVQQLSRYFRHAGPDLTQATWTTKPYPYHAGLDRRIDYVFTTADIKVTDARLIDTHASDHLPILCSVRAS